LLDNAIINDTKFNSANLSDIVSLVGANLTGINFSRADLTGIDLTNTTLVSTDFTDAKLFAATISGANFDEAILTGANLRYVDLSNIQLKRGDQPGLDLKGLDLTNVDLIGVDLIGVDLENTNFNFTNLQGTNFSGAILENNSFIEAKLNDAKLNGLKLNGFNFYRADLTGADLTGADLTGANITEAIFNGTIINGTKFSPNALTSKQRIATQKKIAAPGDVPQRTRSLEEIYDLIQVFDYIGGGDMPVAEYFQENEDKIPYIVVNEKRDGYVYSPNGIRLIPGNIEFVECEENAPVDWQGNSYKKFIKKPIARHFIRIYINGVNVFVLKPDWFDSGIVPGTRFFKLTEGRPLFKYMSLDLSRQILGPDFSSVGADHCNQKEQQQTYQLESLDLGDLNEMISSSPNAGGTKRKKQTKTKRRNSRKHPKRRNSRKQTKTKRRKQTKTKRRNSRK